MSRLRERRPALRDALAARARTIKAGPGADQSKRAERRHTHNVEKRLAEKAPVSARPISSKRATSSPSSRK